MPIEHEGKHIYHIRAVDQEGIGTHSALGTGIITSNTSITTSSGAVGGDITLLGGFYLKNATVADVDLYIGNSGNADLVSNGYLLKKGEEIYLNVENPINIFGATSSSTANARLFAVLYSGETN